MFMIIEPYYNYNQLQSARFYVISLSFIWFHHMFYHVLPTNQHNLFWGDGFFSPSSPPSHFLRPTRAHPMPCRWPRPVGRTLEVPGMAAWVGENGAALGYMAITNKYGDIMLDIIGDNGDMQYITDWWFGTWFFWLSIYWECHHPNWFSYFSEG